MFICFGKLRVNWEFVASAEKMKWDSSPDVVGEVFLPAKRLGAKGTAVRRLARVFPLPQIIILTSFAFTTIVTVLG